MLTRNPPARLVTMAFFGVHIGNNKQYWENPEDAKRYCMGKIKGGEMGYVEVVCLGQNGEEKLYEGPMHKMKPGPIFKPYLQ